MAKENTARVVLVGPMRFDGESGAGSRIVMDVGEQDGGQNAGPSPMELLLVALAGCAGVGILSILRKMHQNVTSYEIRVHGERASDDPKVFTVINVEHIFTGSDLRPESIERAIKLDTTHYCGVNVMLSSSATIKHSFQIRE